MDMSSGRKPNLLARINAWCQPLAPTSDSNEFLILLCTPPSPYVPCRLSARQSECFRFQRRSMKDDDLEANIVAAGSAYSQGRYEEALALYETAITARPQNAILFANKAAILLRLDRVDDALISADRAIELDPTWAKVRARTEVHFVNLWIEEKRDKLALRGVTVRVILWHGGEHRLSLEGNSSMLVILKHVH